MLCRCEHVLRVDLIGRTALQPANGRNAQRRGQERILAVGLFGSAPARVTRQVEHRAEGVIGPLGAHFSRGNR